MSVRIPRSMALPRDIIYLWHATEDQRRAQAEVDAAVAQFGDAGRTLKSQLTRASNMVAARRDAIAATGRDPDAELAVESARRASTALDIAARVAADKVASEARYEAKRLSRPTAWARLDQDIPEDSARTTMYRTMDEPAARQHVQHFITTHWPDGQVVLDARPGQEHLAPVGTGWLYRYRCGVSHMQVTIFTSQTAASSYKTLEQMNDLSLSSLRGNCEQILRAAAQRSRGAR